MVCDAHVHVGYFERKGYDGPFYYSPRRVCSVLRRCGVEAFVFSSTSMQTHGVVFADVHREAREVVRIWGAGAHPFLWVTKRYLAYDPQLSVLDEGLYEGIKLHGRETPWLSRRMSRDLTRVLDVAAARHLPVTAHTGLDGASHPRKWLAWALRYPSVRFDFAHGMPFEVMQPCLAASPNVFTDLSCVGARDAWAALRSEHADRVLWGSDFPALSARSDGSLTDDMRTAVRNCRRYSETCDLSASFARFLGRRLA